MLCRKERIAQSLHCPARCRISTAKPAPERMRGRPDAGKRLLKKGILPPSRSSAGAGCIGRPCSTTSPVMSSHGGRAPRCGPATPGTLELALEASGRSPAKLVHKPKLLSDNGPSSIAEEPAEWIGTKGMSHVRAAPIHSRKGRSAGTRPARTASCWKTASCPVTTKPGSELFRPGRKPHQQRDRVNGKPSRSVLATPNARCMTSTPKAKSALRRFTTRSAPNVLTTDKFHERCRRVGDTAGDRLVRNPART